MKEIYYVGFYNCIGGKNRIKAQSNLAGTMKMDFIIKALKKLGYRVNLISLSIDDIAGFHPLEIISVDEKESHVYIPYFSVKYKGKSRGAVSSLLRNLKKYLIDNLTEDSIVISYHSLAYGMMLSELHRKIRFRWVSQIEELYSLSRKDYQNLSFRETEEKMFAESDGFMFVNDLLPERYAEGKPYAVSYGNYHVFTDKQPPVGNKINVVYTGVINEDRGVFLLMDAMKYLPAKYNLNILGFGSEENMKRFHEQIVLLNSEFNEERIHFFGTRSGEEYTKFLSNQNIGVSLMGLEDNIAENAFPSKIMAYLGHSLFVVSTRSECITKSKVAQYLYFCDNTPKDVAETIKQVPVYSEYNVSSMLRKLEERFVEDLGYVLSRSRI